MDSGSSNTILTYTSSITTPYSASISIKSLITETGSITSPYSASINILDSGSSNSVITYTSSIMPRYSSSVSAIPLMTSSLQIPISGTSDYISTHYNASFTNIHDSWGTSSSDVHFLNMAAKKQSGSFGDFNVLHIEPRYHFYMVGDVEVYSGRRLKRELSIEFIESASRESEITITSVDGTTKTYVALSGSTNGSESPSGSNYVQFATGSGTAKGAGSSSVAGNFLAALTSSNGHGNIFEVSRGTNVNDNSVTIKYIFNSGNDYKTAIYYNDLATSSFNGTPVFTKTILRFDKSDFSNSSRFLNREMIDTDVHKNSVYQSYIAGSPGSQTGKAIGKTRYFTTSSEAVSTTPITASHTLTLPSNHVRKFSNPFIDRMYGGTQNTHRAEQLIHKDEQYSKYISNPNASSSISQSHLPDGFISAPGIMYSTEYEDLSSASFYRVKVTGGENQIIVRSGTPVKDSNNKIIY